MILNHVWDAEVVFTQVEAFFWHVIYSHIMSWVISIASPIEMSCAEAISVGADGSVASWYVKREEDDMVPGGRFPGPGLIRKKTCDVKQSCNTSRNMLGNVGNMELSLEIRQPQPPKITKMLWIIIYHHHICNHQNRHNLGGVLPWGAHPPCWDQRATRWWWGCHLESHSPSSLSWCGGCWMRGPGCLVVWDFIPSKIMGKRMINR